MAAALTVAGPAIAQTSTPVAPAEPAKAPVAGSDKEAAAAPAPTRADAPPEQGQAGSTDPAKTAFEAGVSAYKSGDFANAVIHFQEAQRLAPHPDVLLNLAQSELLAKQYAGAANHFAEYMAQNGDSQLASDGFVQAKTFTAELRISAPAGAEISIDGQAVGSAPLARSIFVVPGEHSVTTAQQSKNLATSAGQAFDVDLAPPATVAPPPAAPPSPEPDAATPETDPPSSGRKPFVDWFVDTPLAWAGAGLAAGGFVTWTVAAATAGRRYDAADDAARQIREEFARTDGSGTPCGPPALNSDFSDACRYFEDKTDEGDTWSTVSVVSLIVGLAATGGVVTYYFLDPDNQETAGLRLMPVVTTSHQGLWLGSSF